MANIEPILTQTVDGWRSDGFGDTAEKRRHVEGSAGRQQVNGLWRNDVDARVDELAPGGFLLEAAKAVVLADPDHTVRYLPIVLAHAHGGGCAALTVMQHEQACIECSEKIAVHDENRRVGARRQETQRARGAKLLAFVQ